MAEASAASSSNPSSRTLPACAARCAPATRPPRWPGSRPTPSPCAGRRLPCRGGCPEVQVVADVDGEPPPHLRSAPAARAPRPVPVAPGAAPWAFRAVDGESAAPASGLLEVSLADGARSRGRLGRLRATRLAIGADGRSERVEANVQHDFDGVRLRLTTDTGPGLHHVVHRAPPGPEWLEHLVGDGTDPKQRIDHLALLFHRVVGAQLPAWQPERHRDIHRPLVGTNPDAAEQARVRVGVIRVEVVGLAPGRVGLDGVGEVVSRIEDRHGYTLVCPAPTFNALTGEAPAASSGAAP